MSIEIPAGAVITCINGHPLYRLKAAVFSEKVFDARDFERIDEGMPLPENGEPIKRECCHCGAVWVDGNMVLGMNVHFENGWSNDLFWPKTP